MKLLRWMQSKLSDKRSDSLPPTDEKSRSELRDWPNGLLAIGTFGYTDIHTCRDQKPFPFVEEEDFSEFTAEEVRSLQKELTKLLGQKPSSKAEADLPLDRFLHSSSELDLDHEENIDRIRTIRIILGRCKDAKKRATGKKSLCFLLKKMFVCGRPSFRDAFQESRMEKLMRSILTNRIYPQNSNSNGASPTKKCIEECGLAENDPKNRHGFKWDKTVIVLEI